MKITKREEYISKLQQAHKEHFEQIKAENIYFCPFCRNILQTNKYSVTRWKNVKYYKCNSCENSKYFNHDTKVDNHTGKPYHIDNDTNTVQKEIQNIIFKLAKEGFSQNEIHNLTHFSKELIRKKLTTVNQQTYEIALSDFMHTRLKMPKEYCQSNNAMKSIKLYDKEIYIQKAFELGLRDDFMAKIFFLSKRDVSKTIKSYDAKLGNKELLDIYKRRELHSYRLLDIKSSNTFYIEITSKKYPFNFS